MHRIRRTVSSVRAAVQPLESRRHLAIDLLQVANTSTASASIGDIVSAGGAKMYFTATDPTAGNELWSSDGTTGGTSRVSDLTPGSASTTFGPSAAAAANGRTLFETVDSGSPATLHVWFTDGTSAGISSVTSAAANASSFAFAASGDLYAYVQQPFGVAGAVNVYRVDAAAPSTPILAATYSGLVSQPVAGTGTTSGSLFYTSGGVLYRMNPDGSVATLATLASSGTSTAVQAVTDTHVYVNVGNSLESVKLSGGTITVLDRGQYAGGSYITILSGNRIAYVINGAPRWTDGTNIYGFGLSTYSSQGFAELGGKVFVNGRTGTDTSDKLYVCALSTGTSTPLPQLVRSGAASQMTSFAGKVYFSGYDSATGSELWQTDGTTAGTFRLSDAMPGPDSSSPGSFRVMGSRLVMVQTTRPTGAELFAFDPSVAATPRLVRDINTAPAALPNQQPSSVRLGDRLLFDFDDYASGTGDELWVSDGTATGTHEVADLVPGTGAGSPNALTRFGSVALFGDSLGRLWRSDGTAAGTSVIATLGSSVAEIFVTAAGDRAVIGTSASGVFRLDSAFNLTAVAADDGATIANAYCFGEISPGHLVMQANDTVHGRELWSLDAGAGLAHRLGNNLSGDGDGTFVRYIDDGVVVRNGVYYAIVQNAQLWRTDGTDAGTYKISGIGSYSGTVSLFDTAAGVRVISNDVMWAVADAPNAPINTPIHAFNGYSTGPVTAWHGRSYFAGSTYAKTLTELYASDGTAAGTVPVRLISDGSPPYNDAQPRALMPTDDALFFTAFTTAAGRELWRTDGTAAGTVLVDDFIPGSADANIFPIGQAGNELIMLATSPTLGRQLFRTAVDVQGPRLTAGTLEHAASGPAARLTFDEHVAGTLTAADFVVTNLTTGATLSSASFTLEPDGSTDGPTTLRLRFAPSLADGRYSVRLRANAATDRWGNAVASEQSITFSSLAGDANDDGVVDFSDLLIVARNYGSTGRSYAQGNLDASADGSVGFADLLLLARSYGKSLPPLAAAAASIVSGPSSAKSTRRPSEAAGLV